MDTIMSRNLLFSIGIAVVTIFPETEAPAGIDMSDYIAKNHNVWSFSDAGMQANVGVHVEQEALESVGFVGRRVHWSLEN